MRRRLCRGGERAQALEQLALTSFALMVLDLYTTDMHGPEALEFVRSHQKFRDLPVVVLTTRGDTASRGEVLKEGASLYLTKPFVPYALAEQVRSLLNDSVRSTGNVDRDSHG